MTTREERADKFGKQVGYSDAIADVRQLLLRAFNITNADILLALNELEATYHKQVDKGNSADYNHALEKLLEEGLGAKVVSRSDEVVVMEVAELP